MMTSGRWATLRSVTSFLTLISILQSGSSAQKADAKCNSTKLEWAFNSRGQSPCLTAAFLGQPCETGNKTFDVTGIKSGQSYAAHNSICECNSVFYSLISACASCQNGTILTWTKFATNCSKINPTDGQYPRTVPNGTTIPEWALQKVYTSNRLNLTLAQSVGDSTPSASANQTSSAPPPPPTSTSPPAQTAVPSEVHPESKAPVTSSKNNAGSVAGGAIGGIIGISILCAVFIFLLRRVRERRQASPPVQPKSERRASSFYLRSSSVREMQRHPIDLAISPSSLKDPRFLTTTDGIPGIIHSTQQDDIGRSPFAKLKARVTFL